MALQAMVPLTLWATNKTNRALCIKLSKENKENQVNEEVNFDTKLLDTYEKLKILCDGNPMMPTFFTSSGI